MKFDGWVIYWISLLCINGVAFVISGLTADAVGLFLTIGMIFFCSSALYARLEKLSENER